MMRCKFDSFNEWLEETSGNRNPLIKFQEPKEVVENPCWTASQIVPKA